MAHADVNMCELERILSEVAKNGTCSFLPWSISSTGSNTIVEEGGGCNYDSEENLSRRNEQDSKTVQGTKNILKRKNVENSITDFEIQHAKRSSNTSYHSLREALTHALILILNKSFKTKGYKPNIIERKSNSNMTTNSTINSTDNTKIQENEQTFSKLMFEQRTNLLVIMLSGMSYQKFQEAFCSQNQQQNVNNSCKYSCTKKIKANDKFIETTTADNYNPPFTIQRLAEILLTPNNYYSQTHKLCNGIEKLLLITSNYQFTESTESKMEGQKTSVQSTAMSFQHHTTSPNFECLQKPSSSLYHPKKIQSILGNLETFHHQQQQNSVKEKKNDLEQQSQQQQILLQDTMLSTPQQKEEKKIQKDVLEENLPNGFLQQQHHNTNVTTKNNQFAKNQEQNIILTPTANKKIRKPSYSSIDFQQDFQEATKKQANKTGVHMELKIEASKGKTADPNVLQEGQGLVGVTIRQSYSSSTTSREEEESSSCDENVSEEDSCSDSSDCSSGGAASAAAAVVQR